jgi:hypothetical protein
MAFTIVNPLYPRPHITAGTSSVSAGFMLAVSSSSSATGFVLANLGTFSSAPAELAFIDIQNANVVVTFDGSTPLYGTSGHILASGSNYTWQIATLLAAKFALQTSATANIYLSQFCV